VATAVSANPSNDQHIQPLVASSTPPLSPRPEDTPAPLFASSPEKSSTGTHPTETEDEEKDTATDTTDPVAESVPAPQSVVMGENEAQINPHIQTNPDGQPVVGDYLKIMFVEHQVVPTILVRLNFKL
jgi:SIT4-associating protein SAP185/190